MEFKFANRMGWSDVEPFEVVRIVNKKTLDIRAMRAERDPTWNPDFVPGGFCGTVVNQGTQRWIITPNTDAPMIRIRLGKKGWKSAGGDRFSLGAKPIKFYDYNF